MRVAGKLGVNWYKLTTNGANMVKRKKKKNAHKDLWGSFGSFEGYVKRMVPSIGVEAVAKALNMRKNDIVKVCNDLGIKAKHVTPSSYMSSLFNERKDEPTESIFDRQHRIRF